MHVREAVSKPSEFRQPMQNLHQEVFQESIVPFEFVFAPAVLAESLLEEED